MAAKRGLDCSVLFNGVDLSRFLKTAAPDLSAELLDATAFQAPGGDKEFLVGFRDGKLSLEGFFSADNINEDDVDDIFNAVIGGEAKQIVTVSPEGADAIGKRAFIMEADTTSYKVSSPAKELIMSNAEMQSSSGLGLGFILHPITPPATATGDNASLDNGAASGDGGAAQIHVIAFDGTTPELDSKVQHSDDDSTWVDLAEFTQVTGITSERLEVDGIGAGNAELVVTAAGMTGSPKTIPFAVAKGDSASIMAGKAREALAADADVTALFAVSGTGASVVLTRLTLAANDGTLNIASDNDTSSGLTPAASSANTTAGVASVQQVETATVGGAATASANVIVTVTGAGITGSPLATNVAVVNLDSAATIGGKIRTALGLVSAITALYTVGGSGADITLTRISAAANDGTLNIAIDGTTNSTGVPDAASSANTTAGVAGVSQVETATIAGTITGTVHRYVRETHTLGGTDPEFTYAVSFARF